MDSQRIEIVGRTWLQAQLTKEGFECAEPLRDRGIDLIVFNDVVDQPFHAVPIQMKVATDKIFSVDKKYIGRGIVMAYIWHVTTPTPRLFLVPHDDAVMILSEQTRGTPSWAVRGYWSTPSPSAKHIAALERYENFGALSGQKFTDETAPCVVDGPGPFTVTLTAQVETDGERMRRFQLARVNSLLGELGDVLRFKLRSP